MLRKKVGEAGGGYLSLFKGSVSIRKSESAFRKIILAAM